MTPMFRDGCTEHDDLVETDLKYKRLLAVPPPGWYTFGTHVDRPDVSLVFWGELDGLPVWEKPWESGR